jgi:hypothetical protein
METELMELDAKAAVISAACLHENYCSGREDMMLTRAQLK